MNKTVKGLHIIITLRSNWYGALSEKQQQKLKHTKEIQNMLMALKKRKKKSTQINFGRVPNKCHVT